MLSFPTNLAIKDGESMHELTIYRLFFTDSDCYKAGKQQTPRGVQVHSTGANNPWLRRYVGPDDGRLGENPNGTTHNRPGGDVCANAYIGKLADGTVAVYQTLPWDYRCWLSGSGNNGHANRLGYIGFEICEDNTVNEEYFNEAVRGAAVLLTAYLCREYGFTPWSTITTPTGDANAVEDHVGLHRLGLASDHADIEAWLKKFGYTFKDFRYWVQTALEEGVKVIHRYEGETEHDRSSYPAERGLRRGCPVLADPALRRRRYAHGGRSIRPEDRSGGTHFPAAESVDGGRDCRAENLGGP